MLVLVVVVYACWACLSLGLYQLLIKPVQRTQWGRCLLLYAIGMLLWQPLAAAIDFSITRALLNTTSGSLWNDILNMRFFYVYLHGVLYTTGFVACVGLIYIRHTRDIQLQAAQLQQSHTEAQRDLAQMKILVLQSQLSPHFLFNCLNAISALARTGATKALITANARLADLLRFAVQASEHALIPIQEELAFTQQYIALQSLRFEQRYHCTIHADHISNDIQCPPFILQTLVENAYQHSGHLSLSFIPIDITVFNTDHRLIFKVCNPQDQQHAEAEQQGLGIALDNLQQRLKMLYADRFDISQQQNGNCFCTSVSIPSGAKP